MKSSGVAREAHFSGQSYLNLDPMNIPALRDNFYAGFGFRTQQKAGLMLYHQAQDGVCQVFLDKGHVVVRAGNSEIRTQKTYNDENSHYVALYSNSNGMRLYVDDSLEKAGEGGRAVGSGRSIGAATQGSFFLGGTPDQPTSNLTGCISNLFIKSVLGSQGVHNLLKVKENVNVPLDCPAAQKPQQILAAPPKPKNKKNRKPAGSRSRSTRESCQGEPSPPETGATHFSGSAHSHQRYDSLPREFSKSLVVDGINAQSKRLPGGNKFHLSGPLYVGGAPLALLLKLNEVPAGAPSHSQGAAPCFASLLHPGAYFSREGGHIAIDDSVVLGKDLEIQVELRARSDSGLLLHAGTSEHFLNVVLNQGEVTVTVNSGSGQFSTSFTPDVSICDGHWHTVTVTKRSSMLQVQVNGVGESGVGPKASRSAGGKHTLYLGGAPDGAVGSGLPAGLPSFHGCVRKATLNHRLVTLNKPLSLHG
ncbi:hypothetical protein CRUP_035250, partial [Coryphaenoides rupestris]